ncbi:MAG TPA: hypothetical protein VNR64_05030 [Vicinamibacterales bacterium]|nr:hypothetical protein [Vicinamibacterales bacterium]
MKRLPDIAMKECVAELRAACRLPVDERGLAMLQSWLRPNFERILAHPDGGKRWADHGHRMRDNARFIGAFADFFGSHAGREKVGIDELTRAFKVIRADCTVRAEVTPVAYEYCDGVPVDASSEEAFLHAFAPIPEPV